MEEIYIESIRKVIVNKEKLESQLGVNIKNKGRLVFIDGPAEKEFTAIEVLKALNLGFSVNQALRLNEDNMVLNTLNIKDITKRNDLERVRARIIGSHGRTLKTIHNLANCDVALKDNQIGIIGDCEETEHAIQAMTSIVQGKKQGNVYGKLERDKKKKKMEVKTKHYIKNDFEL